MGVDIYFDTKDEALIVTDKQRKLKRSKAYAPHTARPGKHWVTALERNNEKGAQKPFRVQTNWSRVQLRRRLHAGKKFRMRNPAPPTPETFAHSSDVKLDLHCQ